MYRTCLSHAHNLPSTPEQGRVAARARRVLWRRGTLLTALSLAVACRESRNPVGAADLQAPVQRTAAITPTGCGRLLPNESIRWGNSIRSCNGLSKLAVQTDRHVVLYDSAGPSWTAPNTFNRASAWVMQADGNLVAYDSLGLALWASGTAGNPGAWLAVQDDCNVVIYRSPHPQSSSPLWTTNTFCRAPVPAPGRILPGERLYAGLSMVSITANSSLSVQEKQGVVLSTRGNVLWTAPNTLNRTTRVLAMQVDGNLVAYDYLRSALWGSGTAGNPGAWAAVQDDCNLVVYRGPYPATNGALWASNTNCGSAGASATSPVIGPFRVTRLENRTCYNAALPTWTFCQHQGPSHAGTGIAGADDRNAWDVNLSGNADVGRPVYATAPGRIVRYGGRDAPGGTSGAVLIEHNSNGRIWWSGYLHLSGILVRLGQDVTTSTVIGSIGKVGANNDHLHFVMYNGTNTVGGLRSFDGQFTVR